MSLAAMDRRLGPVGWIALGVVGLAVAAAVFAPWIAPYAPDQADLLATFAPPSPEHWLGTDSTGRDIASRLLYGARTSLLGPAAIVLLAYLVSVPLALASAWYGGTVAFVAGRCLDVVFAIPGLLLAILAAALFGPGLSSVIIALGIAYVPYVARLVTSVADRERRLPYVHVLAVQGQSAVRISTRHVLRNIAPVLAGQATVTFAYALIDLAALSFLGLGMQAPGADWGVMVSDRDAVLQGHPIQVVATSIVLVATVLPLFLLGGRLSGEDGVVRRGRTRRSRARQMAPAQGKGGR